MRSSTILFFLVLALPFPAFAADECPNPSADERIVRRGLAKEWFIQGEAASKAGLDVAAIKAFQCSMSLIPHGFTAFNLGQVAERSGDLELAIASYEKYLSLMPEAEDSADVRKKLIVLKDRLSKVQESVQVDMASIKKPEETASDAIPGEPSAIRRPTTPSTIPVAEREHAVPASDGFGSGAWITVGAGVVMIGTGVIFNVLARQKMSTSDTRYIDGDLPGAESSRNTARTFAYTSYGLIAVGAVTSAVGVVIGLLPRSGGTEISLLPGGGLALSTSGRF